MLKKKPTSILIFSVLFGYIIVQFLWWEILLVKQTGQIITEKQKLAEISSVNPEQIQLEVKQLHQKKFHQTIMIVGEGTVFLLLLLYGIFKIRKAYLKETELTRQQKNFLLSITHELKTPIAATKLQLQTLQKHKLDIEKQRHLIQNALLENERLNNLVDNVLLASRLDSGEYTLNKTNENISELTEQTIQRYYLNEITKNELFADIEKNIFLFIDKTIFPSVIINLIDNAIKYSFNEKNIKLSLKIKSGKVILSVSDSGCGIKQNDKEKIFNRFYRSGNEETRSSKGTGLGLYIVAYLVKKHDGTIELYDNESRGTVFKITFNP